MTYVYSAERTCHCGAGLAYDDADPAPAWRCAAQLRGERPPGDVQPHTRPKPVDMRPDIAIEADDATTRPVE